MRIILIGILVSLSMLTMAQSYQQVIPEEYGYKVKIGEEVPNFDLVLPNGENTNIKALRGKIIMLQFTASWCSVCRMEMPHIESQIWKKLQSNDDFRLYGIDLKEDKATVDKFQSDMKITYPLALDTDGEIFDMFTVPNAGVTRNVIVDREGKIAYMTRLYKEKEFNEMVDVINALLAE